MPKKLYMKWNGMNSVLGILLVFVLLFVFSPFINFLLYGGEVGNTRSDSCQSNMKQLGLALVQYSQDNDGTIPSIASSNGRGWRETLYPYVKSVAVYQCPNDQSSLSATPEHLPHSYGANVAVMTGKAMSQAAPSILLVDMRGYAGPEWNMTSPAFLPGTGRELYAHLPRHIFYEHPSGTLNVLFNDGHVKAMPPRETLMPTNLWTPSNAPFTEQDLANAQAILTHAESE